MIELATKLAGLFTGLLELFHKWKVRQKKAPSRAVLSDEQRQILSRLYEQLIKAAEATWVFVSPFDASGSPSKKQKMVTSRDAINRFSEFLSTVDFQLPKEIDTTLSNLREALTSAYHRFAFVLPPDLENMSDTQFNAMHKGWQEAREIYDNKVIPLRAKLKEDLRGLCGIQD